MSISGRNKTRLARERTSCFHHQSEIKSSPFDVLSLRRRSIPGRKSKIKVKIDCLLILICYDSSDD